MGKTRPEQCLFAAHAAGKGSVDAPCGCKRSGRLRPWAGRPSLFHGFGVRRNPPAGFPLFQVGLGEAQEGLGNPVEGGGGGGEEEDGSVHRRGKGDHRHPLGGRQPR